MAKLPNIHTQFPDPIVESGADPYVTEYGDDFLYTFVRNDAAVYISKAHSLPGIGQVEPQLVWQPKPGMEYSESLWAPELYRLDNKWYVYVAAGRRTKEYDNQRMYVLENSADDPLQGDFTMRGRITDTSNEWAIDGTVLEQPDGNRYFVWSGRERTTDRMQHLYIAEMADPATIVGERVRISSPTYPWERRGAPINEGPQTVKIGDQQQIIYSASASWRNSYCLGRLSLMGDDPLNPYNWRKDPQPMFTSDKHITAPGHASFLVEPEGHSGWMVYHSARKKGSGWDRQVRMRAFIAKGDGGLEFLPARPERQRRVVRKLSEMCIR